VTWAGALHGWPTRQTGCVGPFITMPWRPLATIARVAIRCMGTWCPTTC